MSRSELVQTYLDGQMGRRVFLRRLVATGVTLATAVTYADLLAAAPAGATAASYYVYVTDDEYRYNPTRGFPGSGVTFGFASTNLYFHSASSTAGSVFPPNTGLRRPGDMTQSRFTAAGRYTYRDKGSPAIPTNGIADVRILISPKAGPVGTQFKLTWATSLPSGRVVDVQRILPGGGTTWQSWITGTTALSKTLAPSAKGLYQYRARVRDTGSGKYTGWCSVNSFTVT